MSYRWCQVFLRAEWLYNFLLSLHPILEEFHVSISHSKPFHHHLPYTVCPLHLENQTVQTSNHKAVLPSLLNSDLAALYIIEDLNIGIYEREHHSGDSYGNAA
jgi:hypothetical protein